MEKLSQELSKIRTALANLDTDIKKVKILRNQETESNLSMFEIIGKRFQLESFESDFFGANFMLLFSMIFSTRLELSLLKLDIGLARFNGIAYIICFTFFVIGLIRAIRGAKKLK